MKLEDDILFPQSMTQCSFPSASREKDIGQRKQGYG